MESLPLGGVEVMVAQRGALLESGMCEGKWNGAIVTVIMYSLGGGGDGWFDGGESPVRKYGDKLLYLKSLQHPNVVTFYGVCLCDGIEEPLLVFEDWLSRPSSVAFPLHGTSLPFSYKQIVDISCDVLAGLRYLNSRDHPLMTGFHTITMDGVSLLADGSAKLKHVTVGVLQEVDMQRNVTFLPPRGDHFCSFSTCSLILEMCTGICSKSLSLDQYNRRLQRLGCSHPLYDILKSSMEPPPNCPTPAELSVLLEKEKQSHAYVSCMEVDDMAGRVGKLETGLGHNHSVIAKLQQDVGQLQYALHKMAVEHKKVTTNLKQQLKVLSDQNRSLRQWMGVSDERNHVKLGTYQHLPADVVAYADSTGVESGYGTASYEMLLENMQEMRFESHEDLLSQDHNSFQADDVDGAADSHDSNVTVGRSSSAPASVIGVGRNVTAGGRLNDISSTVQSTGHIVERTASAAAPHSTQLAAQRRLSDLHPLSRAEAQLEEIIVDLGQIDAGSPQPLTSGETDPLCCLEMQQVAESHVAREQILESEMNQPGMVARGNSLPYNRLAILASPVDDPMVVSSQSSNPAGGPRLAEEIDESSSHRSSESHESTPSVHEERETVQRFLTQIQQEFDSLDTEIASYNGGPRPRERRRPHSVHELQSYSRIFTGLATPSFQEEQQHDQATAQESDRNSRIDHERHGEETRPLTAAVALALSASCDPSSTRGKVIPPCDSPVAGDHLPPMDEAPPPYEQGPTNRVSPQPPMQGQQISSPATPYMPATLSVSDPHTRSRAILSARSARLSSPRSLAWHPLRSVRQYPVWSRVFRFSKTFDKNGVIYYLGTSDSSHSWSNPAVPGIVRVTRSGDESHTRGKPSDAIGRKKGVTCCSTNAPDSWYSFDFGPQRSLVPSYYSLRHGAAGKWSALRNWDLEGSVDGLTWIPLKNHVNEIALKSRYATASWPVDIPRNHPPMRYLRILQTGPNSSGGYHLCISGLEVYGTLFEANTV